MRYGLNLNHQNEVDIGRGEFTSRMDPLCEERLIDHNAVMANMELIAITITHGAFPLILLSLICMRFHQQVWEHYYAMQISFPHQ